MGLLEDILDKAGYGSDASTGRRGGRSGRDADYLAALGALPQTGYGPSASGPLGAAPQIQDDDGGGFWGWVGDKAGGVADWAGGVADRAGQVWNGVEVPSEQCWDTLGLIEARSMELEYVREIVHAVPVRHDIDVLAFT